MAFHMKAGHTFAVPCCSNLQDDQLPPACTVHCELSLTSAVHHLDKVHGEEVDQITKKKGQGRLLPAGSKFTRLCDDMPGL